MTAIEVASMEIPVLMKSIISDETELNVSIIEGLDKKQEKFFIFHSVRIAPVPKPIHIFY